MKNSWLRRLAAAIRNDWREVGSLGRLAFAGVAFSLLLTIALGFFIQTTTRRHLLDARTDILSNVIREIESKHYLVAGGLDADRMEAFDRDVRTRLLGGETLRVKLWNTNGEVIYSDNPNLIGERFTLSPPAALALGGIPASNISDATDPAHADEADVGSLIEFYLPYHGPDGNVVAAFEVEQRTDSLDATQIRIATSVWITIGVGLGLLAVFMVTLLLARAAAMNRRRRQAETLLGSLLQAQEEERARIVGALHDDIGQPMYRLLYGLEGGRSKLPEGDPVRHELDRLQDIVRDVDAKLRAELRMLHATVAEDVGLGPALESLAATTREETDVEVRLELEDVTDPGTVQRAALYRAAQEAVTNIRKHALATRIELHVWEEGDVVYLDVTDDGAGLRGEPGLGLTTTRERLEAIDGGLDVHAKPGGGTVFQAWVPKGASE